MKNKIIYLCIAFSLLASTSCSDFLDTTPQDFLAPENYYNTAEDARDALVGVYNPIGTYHLYGCYMVIDGAMDDLTYWYVDEVTTIDKLYGWNYSAGQTHLGQIWRKLYDGINRANLVLENVGQIDMDEDTKKMYLGEARILRAYYHYLAADWWGDIPLKLASTKKVTDVNIARTSQLEILNKVVQEMEEVVNSNVLNTADKFNHSSRVTQTVAQALLSRVYMKMAGYPLNLGNPMYEKALFWAQKVQESNLHRLHPDYNQIFINHAQDTYDTLYRESMWEADFVGNSITNPGRSDAYGWIGAMNGIACSEEKKIGYSYGFVRIRLKFWDLFDDDVNDVRKDRVISPFSYDKTGNRIAAPTRPGERCMAKWRREEETTSPKHKNYTGINFPIMRYADVLLTIAEAENELRGPTTVAIDAFNEVRARAGVYLYTNVPDTEKQLVTSKEDFRAIIQDDRARELAGEGMRKRDLIRWGIFLDEMKRAAEEPFLPENSARTTAMTRTRMTAIPSRMTEKYLLQPIPQAELNLNNKMTQNKLW